VEFNTPTAHIAPGIEDERESIKYVKKKSNNTFIIIKKETIVDISRFFFSRLY
jgi:hypothetical protein